MACRSIQKLRKTSASSLGTTGTCRRLPARTMLLCRRPRVGIRASGVVRGASPRRGVARSGPGSRGRYRRCASTSMELRAPESEPAWVRIVIRRPRWFGRLDLQQRPDVAGTGFVLPARVSLAGLVALFLQDYVQLLRALDIPTYTTARHQRCRASLMPARMTTSFSRPLKPDTVDQVMCSSCGVPRRGVSDSVRELMPRRSRTFRLPLAWVVRGKDGDATRAHVLLAQPLNE